MYVKAEKLCIFAGSGSLAMRSSLRYAQLASFLSLDSMNMMNEDLNRIKVMLAEMKRSGKWLAEQLGKDQGTVSKWCANTCQPDLKTLVRIAELLDVELSELVRMPHKQI